MRKKIFNSKWRKLAPSNKGLSKFCISFPNKQLISLNCSSNLTATLIDHVLTNSSQNVRQCFAIELGISDHDRIYCTRKISAFKLNKHSELSIRSMKNCLKQKFLELLIKASFSDYTSHTCLNEACQDFIFKLSEVFDSLFPSTQFPKYTKANLKPCIDSETTLAIHKRDKLFKNIKNLFR